jgi:signal transduction histidine kinase/ligand-binding sensor domain-containing protein
MKKAIVALMLLFISLNIFNQIQNRMIYELTYKDGLTPNKDMPAVVQDRLGFIWIGSGNGVQRYDGYEFKKYELDEPVSCITEDKNGILWIGTQNGIYLLNPEYETSVHLTIDTSFGMVFKIMEDKNGNIWCATNSEGLVKLKPKISETSLRNERLFKSGVLTTFDISSYKIPADDSDQGAVQIWDILEDSQNRFWIGSVSGLYVFDKETHVFTRMDHSESGTRLDHSCVFAIREESPDILWVRSLHGISRISNISRAFSDSMIRPALLEFKNYACPQYGDIQFPLSHSFFIDDQHNILLATPYHGLVKMTFGPDQQAAFEEVYDDVHDPGYLFGALYSIMADRTGLIWVSHEYEGIKQFRQGNPLFDPLVNMLVDFPMVRYDFNQIIEDMEGNVWICSWGKGVFRISENGKITNFAIVDPAEKDARENYTISVAEMRNGVFWIGGTGVWQLDAHQGTCQKVIHSNSFIDVIRKVDHYVLLGTRGEGLWIYNLTTGNMDKHTSDQHDTLGFNSDRIVSINVMHNQEIWVSTENNGIFRITINPVTGAANFRPVPEDITRKNKLPTGKTQVIYQVMEDVKGVLWFATSNGLIRFEQETAENKSWTRENGLPWNSIFFIEKDNRGQLWLGTPHGLTVFDPVAKTIRTFDERDGLPEVRHAIPSHSRTRKGVLYFGGVGGFYRVNPDQILINQVIPTVVITGFKLFNRPVKVDSGRKAILTRNISYTTMIDLAYNQNDLSFTFAALDYNNPSKNKYAYKLEGYQSGWIETDADYRIATYTNLKPGKYIFRVKGSNNHGAWNEEGTSVRITIHPPLWKTSWAFIIYGILFLLLLRVYILWRTSRIIKVNAALENQVSERTEELQKVNTLLEVQKEELIQQKEELQSTLENLQRTQEQLIESEKMAAIGGLVAGVAHEINTPVGIGVTAISNLLDEIQGMAEMYEKDEISRKDFKEFLQSSHNVSMLIQKNLERTAALVQSFKQVSVDQITEQQRVFVFKEYLNEILMSLYPKFSGKKIDVRIICDDQLKLNSYPGVYAQIFTNLCLNSLQHGFHIKQSGTIQIEAYIVKDMLKITYIDDGAGISPKDLPHIFEPFYTSDQRKGTGLGLNIVYNLVKQKLLGNITCESESEKGVVFTMDIPV